MTGPETRAAVWFLVSEDGEPLGQVYRRQHEIAPTVGTELANGAGWTTAEIVEFTELRPSCGMRRFRVVVRVDA